VPGIHPSLPAGLADGLAPKDWRYAVVIATRPEVGNLPPQWFPRPPGDPGKLGGVKRGILANR